MISLNINVSRKRRYDRFEIGEINKVLYAYWYFRKVLKYEDHEIDLFTRQPILPSNYPAMPLNPKTLKITMEKLAELDNESSVVLYMSQDPRLKNKDKQDDWCMVDNILDFSVFGEEIDPNDIQTTEILSWLQGKGINKKKSINMLKYLGKKEGIPKENIRTIVDILRKVCPYATEFPGRLDIMLKSLMETGYRNITAITSSGERELAEKFISKGIKRFCILSSRRMTGYNGVDHFNIINAAYRNKGNFIKGYNYQMRKMAKFGKLAYQYPMIQYDKGYADSYLNYDEVQP